MDYRLSMFRWHEIPIYKALWLRDKMLGGYQPNSEDLKALEDGDKQFGESPELLLNLNDFFIQANEDLEIYGVCKHFYPDIPDYLQCKRDYMLDLLNKVSIETKLVEAKSLLLHWIKKSKGLTFILKNPQENPELVGKIAIEEVDPQLSARLIIGIRGNSYTKGKTAQKIIEFFDSTYCKQLYKLKYRFISLVETEDRNQALIQRFDKLQKCPKAHWKFCGSGEHKRVAGKVSVEKWWRLDLWKKFPLSSGTIKDIKPEKAPEAHQVNDESQSRAIPDDLILENAR